MFVEMLRKLSPIKAIRHGRTDSLTLIIESFAFNNMLPIP